MAGTGRSERSGRSRKGAFGEARLPIAGRYPLPGRRRGPTLAALALVALVAGWLAAVTLFGTRRGVAPGPLSTAHANFETACEACHTAASGLSDDGCRVCHERLGETGRFGFAAHAAAFGGDGAGGGQSTALARREPPCAACHPEHRGRQAAITRVADRRCAGCHGFSSLGRGHPELAALREPSSDEPHLRFAHRPHVRELMKSRGWADPQLACLACHRPDADGRGFEPLDFEVACGECHLTRGTATPPLPVGDPTGEGSPGVETLEAIRERGGPDTRWVWFTDPGEVRLSGGRVSKRPVYHRDPWVTTNLAAIRRALYPDLGLAGLLAAAIDGPPAGGADRSDRTDRIEATMEALATLRRRVVELRGSPDRQVQDELRRIEALLDEAERRVRAGESVDLAAFLTPAAPDPALGEEKVEALAQLALGITTPCRRCHVVSQAAVLAVDADLGTYRRAVFSHRAHVIQVPFCTDCHGAIPGLAEVGASGEPAGELADEPLDAASTHNLPGVATCRRCHTPDAGSDACTTCHRFHPRPARRGGLLPYVPPATAAGLDGGAEEEAR